jgi:hypothetical protein
MTMAMASFTLRNPNLATPLRRQKQDYWIREMGTATPHGCSDKIDGIDILDLALPVDR